MKLVTVILSLFILSIQKPCHCQQVDNLVQALINQLNAANNQLAATQLVLAEMARSTAEMFETSAKMVAGQDSETPSSPQTSVPGLKILIENLSALQSLMRDLATEFHRVVTTRVVDEPKAALVAEPQTATPTSAPTPAPSSSSSSTSDGSKTNTTTITSTETQTSGLSGTQTGPQAINNATNTASATARGPSEVLVKTVDAASQQLGQVSKTVTDVTGQFTRFLATGAKFLTGNRGPGVADAALNSLEEFSKQFQAIQQVLREMNGHFNRMIEIGTRALGGDSLKYQQNEVTSPGAVALNILSSLTGQLTGALRVLEDINGQFNRIIATSSRIISGGSSHRVHHHLQKLHRHKRADAQVINGLQRAAGELTQQVGALGGTIARIAGGLTGLGIPGSGGDPNRGIPDGATAFSGLNVLGILSRLGGNVASGLSRVANVGK